jgi:hypothetical protein
MSDFQRRDFLKAVTLTVDFAPIIKTQPVSRTALPMATVTFMAAAVANPAISKIQWEVNNGTGWQPLTGQTAATLRLTATTALSGMQYRVVFTNCVGSTTSSAATLMVSSAPIVTVEPLSQVALVGQTVTVTAAATVANGAPPAIVQWQVSSDGGRTWSNMSGQTHTALTLSAAADLDGNEYRAIFSNTGGSTATEHAMLYIIG